MKVERAPECRCDTESGNGLDHEKWCPFATWYVRMLWHIQRVPAPFRPKGWVL